MIRDTTAARRATRLSTRFGEYYRALAERIRGLRRDGEKTLQTLGVTSCRAGEGVSTVALNLSAAGASIYQSPVLAIDANLSRPAFSRWLRIDEGPGLADVLMGSLDAAEAIQESPEANLSVLTAGTAVSRTRASFDPSRVASLLASLKSDFALVIVDLPPAVQTSTCWNVAPALDGLLLVVEADRVDGEEAASVKRRLIGAGANPVGVVLNKQRHGLGRLNR